MEDSSWGPRPLVEVKPPCKWGANSGEMSGLQAEADGQVFLH